MTSQFELQVATARPRDRQAVDQHMDFQVDPEAHKLAMEDSDECGG